MERVKQLKKKIKGYLKKGQITKNEENVKLSSLFLTKSRKNLTVANLLFNISDQEDLRKILKLRSSFESFDWVIVVSYYAMYTSALAAVAKLGFKSKSHAATITILEHHYVHENKHLEEKHLQQISKAYVLSEDLINKLMQTKTRRETAQYEATPTISKENAQSSLQDADQFITKIEEILG